MQLQLPSILLRNLKSYILAIQNSTSRSVWCKTRHMVFPDESSHQHLLTSLFGSVIVNTDLSGWSRKDALGKEAE